jgi:tRNA pseudouridine13 synthase
MSNPGWSDSRRGAGMQRFGTASVPTHAIGLALLRSDWKRAVDLILRPRPGEDPAVEEARRAWYDDKDLNRAISLMPRRVVAERALLEAFQLMGSDQNLVGALSKVSICVLDRGYSAHLLSKIPRNLRTMYVHAYQSYVWNAIVSVRLKRYGSESPVAGDLVYVAEEEADAAETGEPGVCPLRCPIFSISVTGREKDAADLWHRKPKPKKVKALAEEDLTKYTIFDVIMPLPGTDVAYPGGELGELYKEFLRRDGLDPTDFHRKQR